MLQNSKNHKKNQGFSLVELLVAIAILAIIVVPLLNLFVVGSRTNAKARKVSRATVTAENIMEELKADSVADILRAANGYTVDESGEQVYASLPGVNPFEAVQTAYGSNPVYTQTMARSTSSITATTDDTTGTVVSTTFVANSLGTYQVVMPSVTNGSTTFDALVNFEKDSQKTLENANIVSMNQKDCGYDAQDSDVASNIASQFADANATYRSTVSGAAVMTESDFMSTMTKTITVEITKDAGNNSTKATINTVYDSGDNLTSSADQYISDSNVVFDNYGTTTQLKSIYVYYYPLYNTGTTARDSLVVKNTAGEKVNVYFVCMTDNATYSTYNDANYKVNLDLYDGTAVTAGKFNTTILSNVDDTKFRKDDHEPGLTLTVGNLGNITMEEIRYKVTITLYDHKDSAFGTDALGNTTFSPDENDYVTNFTSSVLDNSVRAE